MPRTDFNRQTYFQSNAFCFPLKCVAAATAHSIIVFVLRNSLNLNQFIPELLNGSMVPSLPSLTSSWPNVYVLVVRYIVPRVAEL